MAHLKRIQSALISVYHKQGLEPLVAQLVANNAICYSTGGTADYLRNLGATVVDVADLTGYPSILAGRVKTLHPKVHGGILARRNAPEDQAELETYDIPLIDLVVVDLYPFEETVRELAEKAVSDPAAEAEIIEKIDIGGIALIRGAAKNFEDVVIVPSAQYYAPLTQMLQAQDGGTTLEQRRGFAGAAFAVSSAYDSAICRWFHPQNDVLRIAADTATPLRYGENPHQKSTFYGDLAALFTQLNGKELSYNNLVDIEATLALVDEFAEPAFAVIKHTNPCGVAIGSDLLDAWKRALESDPVSAFGGVIACNGIIDTAVAEAINPLFCEVLIANDFTEEALVILRSKKNRILLRRNATHLGNTITKSVLHGFLVQEKDLVAGNTDVWDTKTTRKASPSELTDAIFGEKVVKHLKSNAIAIVKNGQLIGSGVGQTSRIDALRQSIEKAAEKGFDLRGAVLASDAFFPFADSVETAHNAGIEVIVQPGGSVKDADSIQFCEEHGMCLIFTGTRHFKH